MNFTEFQEQFERLEQKLLGPEGLTASPAALLEAAHNKEFSQQDLEDLKVLIQTRSQVLSTPLPQLPPGTGEVLLHLLHRIGLT